MEKVLSPEKLEESYAANAAKANILFYAGKIAREARFVGVHLAIATQRPDAKYLEGEFRSNLTSGAVLVKPKAPPAPETLRMVFPGTSTEASAVVEALDNGSKGLALVAAEGGSVSGIKVGFAEAYEIPTILEELGISKPDQWVSEEPEVAIATTERTDSPTPTRALTESETLLAQLFGE